jgi:hypothetical protein
MKAPFDTNILVDYLNAIPEARAPVVNGVASRPEASSFVAFY